VLIIRISGLLVQKIASISFSADPPCPVAAKVTFDVMTEATIRPHTITIQIVPTEFETVSSTSRVPISTSREWPSPKSSSWISVTVRCDLLVLIGSFRRGGLNGIGGIRFYPDPSRFEIITIPFERLVDFGLWKRGLEHGSEAIKGEKGLCSGGAHFRVLNGRII